MEECVRALAERGPDAKVVAGGTDLLPQLKNGLLRAGCVVDLSGVAPLRSSRTADGAACGSGRR